MSDKADVLVVGAGIVGLFTALEFARKGYDVIVVEKNDGPGHEATSRNAGVIHVLQLPFNSLKSRLCIEGNRIYHEIDEEYGLGIRWVSAYLASTRSIYRVLSTLLTWYLHYKLPEDYRVRLVDSKYLRRVEPLVSRNVKVAIEVQGYGVVHPPTLASRIAEIVEELGSISYRDTVHSINVVDDYVLVESERSTYKARMLVNSAGLYADDVASMVGDEYRVIPIKGVMTVYDSVKIDSILAWLRIEKKHETKGGGVIPHPRGTLLGPTYGGIVDKTDYAYSDGDIVALKDKFQPLIDGPLEGPPEVIVGLRATTEKRDFIIEYSQRSTRVIHLVGIESPGLTAAPAIAKRVAGMARRVLP